MQEAYQALLIAEATFQQTIDEAVAKLVPQAFRITANSAEGKRVKTAQAKHQAALKALTKAQLTLTRITQQSRASARNADLKIAVRKKAHDDARVAQKA